MSLYYPGNYLKKQFETPLTLGTMGDPVFRFQQTQQTIRMAYFQKLGPNGQQLGAVPNPGSGKYTGKDQSGDQQRMMQAAPVGDQRFSTLGTKELAELIYNGFNKLGRFQHGEGGLPAPRGLDDEMPPLAPEEE